MKDWRATCRGFSLVGAIFVLLVLSSISVYLLAVSAVQRDAATSAVLGSRARLAAAAGLEWALDDIVNAGGAALSCSPSGSVTFTLVDAALDGFVVQVLCSSTSVVEGARAYTHYELESIASRGTLGALGYVTRRILATAAF